ncbi:DUF4330 domain-containing protein [Bacilliculturomica massiliensis]|uniref:DUF4330 domain-containing protein n=1 Tax=Bacilliculturomica massiliensis TaxID=1917867 RepID=UPI0013EF2B79|nr:DUF4330 domain-containing protein [Bacilliculturomica massiliensis]
MRIVNEKGKLFGIINVVDLLILLAVIVAVGAVATQVFGNKVQEAISPQVDCIAEVTIIGTPPRIVREVERQNLVGARLVSGNEYMNATVEDVIIEEYVVQAVTADGTIVDAHDPSKKDVTFKIKTQVSRDTPSPKIGSQELRAGKTFIVKTQTFECSGTIRYVQIGE